MPTIAEVELMNRGFDRMADTLLRKRMLEEQAKERDAQRGERERERTDTQAWRGEQLQLDRDKMAALERKTQLGEKFKRMSEASEDLRSSIKLFPDLARAGGYSNEELSSYLVQSAKAAGPEIEGQLRQKAEFKPYLEGKVDWAKLNPAKEPGQMETAATRNLAKRLELEMAVRNAQTQEEHTNAQRALALWQEERGTRAEPDEFETVTESEEADTAPYRRTSVTYKRPRGAAPSAPRATEGGAPNAAVPLPKSQSQLVKGRRYQTARGEATWDGTQFVK